jgi:restriction system protein
MLSAPRMRHGASQQCLLPNKEFPYLTGVPHVTWLACSVMNLCHASIRGSERGTAMARRKGGLTELLDIASALPWKVAAALIPISFVFFHVIAAASDHSAAPTDVAGLGPAVIRAYIHTFALLFQYLFPFAFLVGAGVSFAKRSLSARLFDGVRSDPNVDVSGLSWREFESLVGEGFRHRGFAVTERGGAGPDGGVDLSLARGHERFLVQCKQWRAQQVGVSVVRELYGVMAAEHVAGGYVVTSGSFTKDAKAFAAGRNIELLDGKALDGLLRDGNSAVLRPVDSMPEIGVTKPKPPVCPKCKVSMVLRTAKKGANVGGSFWGCAQYPRCRQTVGIG